MNLQHQKISGLSGNELFCLQKLGAGPGPICVGNSVVAIGIGGGIGAGISNLAGGEVSEVTNLVRGGRQASFSRMLQEAKGYGGDGITGIAFDLINHGGNLEFITTGSIVKGAISKTRDGTPFSSFADAQELYCQVDSGFKPLHFVFGNVAYSIGIGGTFTGAFRSLARGEVPQYTKIFDHTRHLALSRLINEAKNHGANAVVGVETSITPVMGTQEMMMMGTAAYHPLLEPYREEPVTSDMTSEEMWNIVNLGYMPIRLVMGVSVSSLGLTGGILSFFQNLGGGEISGLTEILYEARERALARVAAEAERYGADEVMGVKLKVYDLGGGIVEFMAIGTAVKKIPGAATLSPQILPQAIIQDRDTFVDASDVKGARATALGRNMRDSATRLQVGPLVILGFFLFFLIYALKFVLLLRAH